MPCMAFLKETSMASTISAIIKEATITINALFCSSFQVGQDTLCTNSLYASLKYVFIFNIRVFFSRDYSLAQHPCRWLYSLFIIIPKSTLFGDYRVLAGGSKPKLL